MTISPQDFGASFKGFLDQVSAAAPVEEPALRKRLGAHFAQEPDKLPTLTEKFPLYDHANLHLALESELSGPDCSVELLGVMSLPDAPCRRRLLALYAEGLPPGSVDLEGLVQRTEGASAAFIREMMRKAALFAADEANERIDDRHLVEAIHELVVEGGALTRSLLGFA